MNKNMASELLNKWRDQPMLNSECIGAFMQDLILILDDINSRVEELENEAIEC